MNGIQGHWVQPPQPGAPARFVREGEFGQGVENYTGPKDGKSHPVCPRLMKSLNHLMVTAEYRCQVEGTENFPEEGEGTFVYASSHPTVFDPPVVADVVPGHNLRFVAAENVFETFRGRYMTAGGAFPVDLNWGRLTTVRHAIEKVTEGRKLIIYPEGKISHQSQKVERLKRGAAVIAHHGGARGIVPMAVDYQPDPSARPTERLVGALLAAGLGVGVAMASGAAPLAGAIGLGTAGFLAGGKAARWWYPKSAQASFQDPFPRYFSGLDGSLKGAGVGALAGAAVGLLAPAALPGLGLAGSLGVLGLSEALASRPLARVKIGEPILLEDYFREGVSDREASFKLTEELHRSIGKLKADLTGVPYDEQDKKVFTLDEPLVGE